MSIKYFNNGRNTNIIRTSTRVTVNHGPVQAAPPKQQPPVIPSIKIEKIEPRVTDKKINDKIEVEKIIVADKKAEEEKIVMAKIEADKKAEEEKIVMAKIESDKKTEEEKKATDKIEADKAEEEKKATDKKIADKAEEEKKATDKKIADKIKEEKIAGSKKVKKATVKKKITFTEAGIKSRKLISKFKSIKIMNANDLATQDLNKLFKKLPLKCVTKEKLAEYIKSAKTIVTN